MLVSSTNQNSFYGQFIQPAYQSELDPVGGVTYPFYTLLGGGVRAELTPAPISFRSPWQYSAYAEPCLRTQGGPCLIRGARPCLSAFPMLMSQVLSLPFAPSCWCKLGANSLSLCRHGLALGQTPMPPYTIFMAYCAEEPKAPSWLISADPYFAYLTPSFQARVVPRYNCLIVETATLL